MSDLLDQAIVDAEALKEVALRNAEATILDKFSDQIKEAVEQILEAEEDALDAEEEAPEEDPGLEDVELANAEGLEMCPCPDETEVVHVDLTDLEKQFDEKGEIDLEGEPALSDEEEDMAQALTLESLEIDESILEEIAGNQTSNEITLEEDLLEELAAMLDEQDNMGMPADVEAEEAKAYAAQNPADAPYVEESLEINEEASEEVVEEALTVDINPLATQKSGWGPPPNAVFELAEEELLAALQDSEQRERHDEMQKALKDLQESYDKLQADAETLASKKKELIGVVGSLKDRLNESNLSNAKLLYTNKVLMSDSLNERQKNKIVEALSNSESVEEAKVIYETLQSATGSTIKNNQPESLSEAMNKTTSTLILSHRKRDRENTTQNDSSVDRWKILAGLTKK